MEATLIPNPETTDFMQDEVQHFGIDDDTQTQKSQETSIRVSLVIASGKGDKPPKSLKVKPGVSKIGRTKDCVVRPKLDAISDQHCAVICDTSNAWIEDLGSETGTFVNSHQLKPNKKYQLHHRDRVRIGKFRFAIVIREVSQPWAAIKSETEIASMRASTNDRLDQLLELDTEVFADTPASPAIDLPCEIDVSEILPSLQESNLPQIKDPSAHEGITHTSDTTTQSEADSETSETEVELDLERDSAEDSLDESELGDLLMEMDEVAQQDRISGLLEKHSKAEDARRAQENRELTDEEFEAQRETTTEPLPAVAKVSPNGKTNGKVVPADDGGPGTEKKTERKPRKKKPQLTEAERKAKEKEEKASRKKREKQQRKEARAARPSLLSRLALSGGESSSIATIGVVIFAIATCCFIGYLLYQNLLVNPNEQHMMFKE